MEIIFTKIFIVFVEVGILPLDNTPFFETTTENSHNERGLTDWSLIFLQHAQSFLQ